MSYEIIQWNRLAEDEKNSSIQRPVLESLREQGSIISSIFESIASEGDQALKRYTRMYDGVEIDNFLMNEKEIESAFSRTPRYLMQSIENAIENVKTFHQKNISKDAGIIKVKEGVKCQVIRRPIENVGLYIPAGNNPLPSTAIMLGVPSSLANNKQSFIVSPPNNEGLVNDSIVVAARLSGIGKIFKAGGAQSIAAMAQGTESIPQADKIFGPGNSWVTKAKQMISTLGLPVSIDMPAGPTEVMIISDGNTNPKFIAYDLLSQAEHGIDSQVILISPDESFLKKVSIEIDKAIRTISTREIARISMENSKLIFVDALEEAFNISNIYAPEHLIINCQDAEQMLPKISSAGSVFLGEWSPESAGDYCSGTNHVLPTAGFASSYSGLSVDSFCKSISVQSLTREGLQSIGDDIINLAMAEGLEAHAKAVAVRIEE
ncbi:MAG: histidinol dehydrogenase [Gammaproteobacteria bacterium]|jgi:histidinol dehydrogenase|nr:histidinol dehydrogenase [Gammaproteobacteria bacterium]MBQ08282.1 histidinol dehydrogenase [Gammaproteobacteria bacterium]|tara:strand:- start:11790 stop:13091 length:1302 start_codon:yes stop_codon:yes gene_type:complete